MMIQMKKLLLTNILKSLKGKPQKSTNKEYVNKIIEQKKAWKIVVNMSFVRLADLGIIIATVLNFSKTIENIIEILIELLRTKHLNNFKVLFDLISVKDADEEKIAKSFYRLFNDETEYFNCYENGEIVKKFNKNKKENKRK